MIKFQGVTIEETPSGVSVQIFYLKMNQRKASLYCEVMPEGINYAATGTLDAQGMAAFSRLVAIATLLIDSL